MKRISAIILVLISFMTLAGCDILKIEESMAPPKAGGIYKGIEDALQSSVEGDVTLKFPREGETLSAFHIISNKTDEEDAIAVYALGGKSDTIHFNLLKRRDGEWRSVYDLASGASEIERLELIDFDGDGALEIIFSYLNPINTNSGYALIDMQYEVLTVLLEDECTAFVTEDFNHDSRQDLLTITLDTIKRQSAAQLYSFQKGKLERIGFAALDGSVGAYTEPVLVKYNEEDTAIYIDGIKNAETLSSNQSMVTELIYFDDDKLIAPFSRNATRVNTDTLRNFSITSKDMDSDEVIEIPDFLYFTDEDMGEWEYVSLFREYDFENRELVDDFTAYVNENEGYYFILSNFEGYDDFTVTSKRTDNTFTVKRRVGENEKEIFTFKKFTAEGFTQTTGNYTQIYRTDKIVYAVKLNEELSIDNIKKSFGIYEDR